MVEINKENIKISLKLYDYLENWKIARNTLTLYFQENKYNNNENIILIKVVLIDSLYKTNLKKEIDVAKHIKKLDGINQQINEGNIEAINRIMNWEKKIFSFATKYCHFHEKNKFPIYDKYVSIALNKSINWKEYKDPYKFFQAINNFKIKYDLQDVSYEEIDTYLWLLGQKFWIEERQNKNKNVNINLEVWELYKKNKELFDKLIN